MKKFFAACIALSFSLALLTGCNDTRTGKGTTDSTGVKKDTNAVRPENDSAIKLVQLSQEDARKFIRHWKSEKVDAYRKLAMYTEYDASVIRNMLPKDAEVEYIRVHFAAFPDEARFGDRRNWPTTVIKIRLKKNDLNTGTPEPDYYRAGEICPPPTGTCDEEI